AHDLFAGSWEFLSITDNGENLGPRLVALKLAQDGRLEVSDRTMSIVNPETGETRSATFLVDPAKTPRRSDRVTKKDRIVRGIYQFQQEGLTICLQPDQDKGRQDDFSAPQGSGQMLLKLKLSGQPFVGSQAGSPREPKAVAAVSRVEKPASRDGQG